MIILGLVMLAWCVLFGCSLVSPVAYIDMTTVLGASGSMRGNEPTSVAARVWRNAIMRAAMRPEVDHVTAGA